MVLTPALELCPTPLEILADESLTSFSISLFLYTLSYLSYFITCLFTVETFDQILKGMLFVLISVCHDIDQWPFPEAGHTLQLPLMGNVMQV